MAAAPKLMTADDYFNTPETLNPAELAFGVLRVADAPTPRHQSAVADLFIALERHVRERRLGKVWLSPLDVVLDEKKALIVQPDLMFISNERASIVRDRVRGGPDLVVEVLSPHPRIGTLSEHLQWFAQYGVRECWLLDQNEQRISVIEFQDGEARPARLVGAAEPIQSAVLPEMSLRLRDILTE
ncbi:MAG: Uma2 family endonuclease [Vicinamibacterales bacterium]